MMPKLGKLKLVPINVFTYFVLQFLASELARLDEIVFNYFLISEQN